MVVAVPMSIIMMGVGVLVQSRHRACHQVGAQLVVDLHADVEPGFHAGSHDHGGLPRSRVRALAIMKLMGGTTLEKIAPLTSRRS